MPRAAQAQPRLIAPHLGPYLPQVVLGEALVEAMLLAPARRLTELSSVGEVPKEQLKGLLLQVPSGTGGAGREGWAREELDGVAAP